MRTEHFPTIKQPAGVRKTVLGPLRSIAGRNRTACICHVTPSPTRSLNMCIAWEPFYVCALSCVVVLATGGHCFKCMRQAYVLVHRFCSLFSPSQTINSELIRWKTHTSDQKKKTNCGDFGDEMRGRRKLIHYGDTAENWIGHTI